MVMFCFYIHADVCACSNVDIRALKREAEFYCITPLSVFTCLLCNIILFILDSLCQCLGLRHMQ